MAKINRKLTDGVLEQFDTAIRNLKLLVQQNQLVTVIGSLDMLASRYQRLSIIVDPWVISYLHSHVETYMGDKCAELGYVNGPLVLRLTQVSRGHEAMLKQSLQGYLQRVEAYLIGEKNEEAFDLAMKAPPRQF